VLADAALPLLAAPLESDEEELLEAVGEALPVVEVVVTDAVAAVAAAPAFVAAARPASAATAIVPTTADVVVSFLRRRRARSRSATVILRLRGFTIGSGGCVFTHLRMRTSP
jgi:rhodanese-related sulfurtransferase